MTEEAEQHFRKAADLRFLRVLRALRGESKTVLIREICVEKG